MKSLTTYKENLGDENYRLWLNAAKSNAQNKNRDFNKECKFLSIEPSNSGLKAEEVDIVVSGVIDKYS